MLGPGGAGQLVEMGTVPPKMAGRGLKRPMGDPHSVARG